MFDRFTPAQSCVLVLSFIVLVVGLLVGYRIGDDADDADTEEQVEYTIAAAASVPLTVHVVGAVQRPGLCTLASGARVRDAVQAAGGFTADADTSSVNLAAFVDDGEQIRVEAREAPEPEPQPAPAPVAVAPEPSETAGAASAPASPVLRAQASSSPRARTTPPVPAAEPSNRLTDFTNGRARERVPLNRAGLDELQSIPGVGPEIAKNIIYYRSAHGPFRRFDDLDDVPGIGPATVDKIRVSATLN